MIRILHVSDLHIDGDDMLNKRTKQLRRVLSLERPDVIVITGDIFESNLTWDPYATIADMVGDETPVIFTLGNHEFFYRSIKETKNFYWERYAPDEYNVHCLDLLNFYEIGDVRYLGNVLWYDGSQASRADQNVNSFADGAWADRFIRDFDYIAENLDCTTRIYTSLDTDKIKVLCTHHTPHIDLNAHCSIPGGISDFNAYGGMLRFLETIDVDYALCGHTHSRDVGRQIGECFCSNVGHQLSRLEYFLLEVPDFDDLGIR
jgi:predicted MPP superfamily phosphohydrolase